MTKTISRKPNTQASTPSAGRDASMQRRRNRRSMRRFPPKVPGAEIYVEIAKSLSKVGQNFRSGRFDGRPDLVFEAFAHLNDLKDAAYDAFFELHRENCEDVWALHNHVQSVWGRLCKNDADAIMQRRRNRRSKRRPPAEIPGAEIYFEIAKSLGNVQRNILIGEFNGRPDLVMEACKELNELNSAACDTFIKKHREACEEVRALHTRVQAFWDVLWKRDAKK